ncbi:MAG: hypothetical protein FWC24_07220, partial [Treponema sp.]|nr:hypothetical protein [Treponema sp.]
MAETAMNFDYPQGASPEEIWAILRDIAQSQRETEKIIRESAESHAKMQAEMQAERQEEAKLRRQEAEQRKQETEQRMQDVSRPGVKLTLGEGNEEGIYNLQRSVQGA